LYLSGFSEKIVVFEDFTVFGDLTVLEDFTCQKRVFGDFKIEIS